MEPYQVASEKMRRSGELPINIGKNVGISAIGGAAARFGTQAVSKLIPRISALINDYVPENIAVKGLEKIDPRFKTFMEGAIDSGYSFDDIKEFMKEKISKSEQPKENRNIIEQYSPELHQFIDQQVKAGLNPIQAGAIAQNKKEFGNIIKKLSKDHNTPWSNIIESVYGTGQEAQQQQMQQVQQQQRMQQTQGEGQGSQRLMQAIQQLRQLRGGQ